MSGWWIAVGIVGWVVVVAVILGVMRMSAEADEASSSELSRDAKHRPDRSRGGAEKEQNEGRNRRRG
jgi:hypothetical protein